MRNDWESHLEQWASAGLVDAAAAGQIRQWEANQARPGGLRWPIWLALAFGVLTLGAGVLLFVSSHWDQLAPGQRMTLVVLMIAVFHAAGAAVAGRFPSLAIALHTIGTVSLGAGIALAGQIYHISEHWPAAILLWAVGAAIAWALLRHWTQATLVAVLVPWWLAGEWLIRVQELQATDWAAVAAGICALSLTYLGARHGAKESALRKALVWLGGLALLPAASITAAGMAMGWQTEEPSIAAWSIAAGLPLAVAVALRGRAAIWNLGSVAWTMLLAVMAARPKPNMILNEPRASILVYAWCAIGAVGLAWWGIREARSERINLAVAGFAITLLCFYFSNVMDKFGRSASLVVLGLLFLGGGWLLEKARRRLISQIRQEGA